MAIKKLLSGGRFSRWVRNAQRGMRGGCACARRRLAQRRRSHLTTVRPARVRHRTEWKNRRRQNQRSAVPWIWPLFPPGEFGKGESEPCALSGHTRVVLVFFHVLVGGDARFLRGTGFSPRVLDRCGDEIRVRPFVVSRKSEFIGHTTSISEIFHWMTCLNEPRTLAGRPARHGKNVLRQHGYRSKS